MPLYLTKFSYTPETWARLIAKPEDRRKAAQVVHRVGRREAPWLRYAFGAHDGYNLLEAPDNVSMAAVALAIGGGGALSSIETTVFLTVDETMEALRKAEKIKDPSTRRVAPRARSRLMTNRTGLTALFSSVWSCRAEHRSGSAARDRRPRRFRAAGLTPGGRLLHSPTWPTGTREGGALRWGPSRRGAVRLPASRKRD